MLYVYIRRQIFLTLHDIELGLHLKFLLLPIFDEFLYLSIQRFDHVFVRLIDSQQLDKRLREQVFDCGFNLYRDRVVLWWLHLVKELLRLSYGSDGTLVALMLVKDLLDCLR